MKAFAIDFVSQIIKQTLKLEHIRNNNYIGDESQVGLFSFYEHLQDGDNIDRYVECVRELTNQQNRTDLIANGIISTSDNPTYVNLNKNTIIPLSFNVDFRTTLADRNEVLDTIYNLIHKLKGRKRDVAMFDNGKLFMVGTIANNVEGNPVINFGDYIGEVYESVDTEIKAKLTELHNEGIDLNYSGTITPHLYFSSNGKLKVAIHDSVNDLWKEQIDDGTYDDIIFPPSHNSFTKWKVSLSFEAQNCRQPYTLNAEELCDIYFGGSATICNESVMLGNDLTKLSISKDSVMVGDTKLDLSGDNAYGWYEPLELPSSLNANSIPNQLKSYNFNANSHADSLAHTLQYTFILDSYDLLLSQWFEYARYGMVEKEFDTEETIGISPNMIYQLVEIWSCWGVIKTYDFYTKLVGDINIENTESDTLTISISMQIQK